MSEEDDKKKNDNVILFPAERIKRKVSVTDKEHAARIKSQKIREFVELNVDEIALEMLRKFVALGIRSQKEDFTKDLALVIDCIRGLLYRDFDTQHPAQELADKMVRLKQLKQGGRTAKIDYSVLINFNDKKQNGTKNPLGGEVKKELKDLEDGSDMFEPDGDLDPA